MNAIRHELNNNDLDDILNKVLNQSNLNIVSNTFPNKTLDTTLQELYLEKILNDTLKEVDQLFLKPIETKLDRVFKEMGKLSYNTDEASKREIYWQSLATLYLKTTLPVNRQIDEFIAKIKHPMTVLDLGCGLSGHAILLAEKNCKVIALDSSKKVLDIFDEFVSDQNSYKNISFVHSTIENYTFSKKVDLIIAASSLPYINPASLKKVWNSIFDALNPEGHFIGNLFCEETLYQYSESKEAAEEIKNENTFLGAWHIRRVNSINTLLTDMGFSVKYCTPAGKKCPWLVNFLAQKPK